MNTQPAVGDLDLRRFVGILRRRWLTIAGITLVVTVAALGVSLRERPVYEASSQILLRPALVESLVAVPAGGTGQVNLGTEIEIMRSDTVAAKVVDALGYGVSPRITPKAGADLVVITVADGDPERAARSANAYAEVYAEVRRSQALDEIIAVTDEISRRIADIDDQLREQPVPSAAPTGAVASSERSRLESLRLAYQSQLDQLRLTSNLTRSGGVQLVSAATAPSTPVSPTPKRTAALAFIIGLFGGIVVATILEVMDTRIRTKDELETATGGAVVVGLIPQVSSWRGGRQPSVLDFEVDDRPVAEAYRALRTAVQFVGLERDLQVLQCTSPNPAEGKTTTVANLGMALAHAGKRVVLVDADLRRPRLQGLLGLTGEVGFTNLLLGDEDLSGVVQRVPGRKNLHVIGTGPLPPNPSELLASRVAQAVIEQLRSTVDYVLIDSAPVLPVTDAQVLARLVDGVILVASSDRTTARDVSRTCELLAQGNAPVVGWVLNGAGANETYSGRGYYRRHRRSRAPYAAAGGRASGLRAVSGD